MPRKLKEQIHQFLHDYRKSVFELEHDSKKVEERHEQAEHLVEEILDQKFHYHFHKKVDEDRAETIQMIHNYCREALLPPVVNRFAERLLVVEQRHALALEFVERILDYLAEELEQPVDPS